MRLPSSDDEFYEDEWYPTFIGAIMDLYSQEEQPKRRWFWQKPQATPEPPKATFGFGRVLDESEEQPRG